MDNDSKGARECQPTTSNANANGLCFFKLSSIFCMFFVSNIAFTFLL